MEARFRNRLVGAVILASLAVIFVPMILTGEGELDLKSRGPTIPPEPDYSAANLLPVAPSEPAVSAPTSQPTVVEQTGVENDAESVAPVSPPDAIPPENTPVPTTPDPGRAVKGVPAWAVQVGSFSNKKSAFTLRDQLRAKGFAAYVESVKSGPGVVFRVRVGPELRQDLVQRLQERIANDTGTKGIIVSHH